MNPTPPSAELAVLQLDSYETSRRHDLAGPHPTPLAPRRISLAGRYRSFDQPDDFAEALRQQSGQVLLLLHENDRSAALGQVDLAARLRQEPPCWLVLYSGGWVGWGDCTLERLRLFLGESLPEDLWQNRWAAMPWSAMTGLGRPLAWLGLGWLDLKTVCAPVRKWCDRAVEGIITDVGLDDPARFDHTVRRVLLQRSLLVEALDGERPAQCPTPVRRRQPGLRLEMLLHSVDQLWLLEGLAQYKGWPRVADRLDRARLAVEKGIGQPPSADRLADEDKPLWTPTVETIEDICREPLGET